MYFSYRQKTFTTYRPFYKKFKESWIQEFADEKALVVKIL